MKRRTVLLEKYMNNTIRDNNRRWDFKNTSYVPNHLILCKLSSILNKDIIEQSLLKKIVPIYVHKVQSNMSDKDYKKRQSDIIGAELDNNFDDTFAKKEALEFPKNKGIGLIIFERSNDYLILDKSTNSLSESIEMSRNKKESISNLQLGARAGAAGGIVFPQTNSHSLNNSCRSKNSKLSAHKKGVGVSCKYINEEGDIKEFKSVYNYMFMYRINQKKIKIVTT